MSNKVTFELTALEAKKLLEEIEYGMQFVNRDAHQAHLVWYLIAIQLQGGTYDEASNVASTRVKEYREGLAQKRAQRKADEAEASKPWWKW